MTLLISMAFMLFSKDPQSPECFRITGYFQQDAHKTWIEVAKGSHDAVLVRFKRHARNLQAYRGVYVQVAGEGRRTTNEIILDSVFDFNIATPHGLELAPGRVENLPASACKSR